jgi:16S rRNA (guanine(966)-N(2))-methyltransferase RsmD
MPGLRVIAGTARGRRLRSVPGDTTRPITDRIKEALFNIIGADIAGAAFLDLFAGTGSVGIEALSRGAAWALFVDLNRAPVEVIRHNLSATGLAQRAAVLRMDGFALLSRAPDRPFDYIYIAPPQYQGLWCKALREVDRRPQWMSEDAWVIVQIHPVEEKNWIHAEALQHLRQFDRRDYGSTLLLFYERAADLQAGGLETRMGE